VACQRRLHRLCHLLFGVRGGETFAVGGSLLGVRGGETLAVGGSYRGIKWTIYFESKFRLSSCMTPTGIGGLCAPP
jgi:hypothetical protein